MCRELCEGEDRGGSGGGKPPALPSAAGAREQPLLLPSTFLLLLQSSPLLPSQLPPLLLAHPLLAAHSPLPLPPPSPSLLLLFQHGTTSLNVSQKVSVASLHFTEASPGLLPSSSHLVLLLGTPDLAFQGLPIVAPSLVSLPPVLVPFVCSVVDNVWLVSHLLCPVAHAIALVCVDGLDEVDIEPLERGVW